VWVFRQVQVDAEHRGVETGNPRRKVKTGVPQHSVGEIDQTLAAALAEGCGKLDLFYMVGLSGQTPHYDAGGRGLLPAPGGTVRRRSPPTVLDPGSRAYEHLDRLGFHRHLTTLAEHRAALLDPTWRDLLSYETDWISRDEIVAATTRSASSSTTSCSRRG
jgi:hypothetical protein